MKFMKKDGKGLLLCLVIAVPCWFLGNMIPVVGGAVFAMLAGMVTACFLKHREPFQNGIAFTAKYILQGAVIFLGFGMNLTVVIQTGKQSLPIIISTISISLITAFVMSKALRIPSNASILIGVGSSICGGSAIAATAPVIRADDDEVAQSSPQSLLIEFCRRTALSNARRPFGILYRNGRSIWHFCRNSCE